MSKSRGSESPLPGPFRESFWRSPIRGPWLTSVFGLVLLVGVPVMFVTGLLSYAAYNPNLASVNDETPDKGILGFYLFSWPTHPIWLYRVTQGTHVTLGIVLVPILLFKLWSVLPKLFEWPPLHSIAHFLERISLILVVGGGIFEFATGILNIQTYYIFPEGNFYALHFYGGWVFIAGFVIHVAVKLPAMVRALRSISMREVLSTNTARTRPEPLDAEGLVALRPDPPTISRRGMLAFAGGASVLAGGLIIGQSLGGVFRKTALLSPHGQEMPASISPGSPDFQVNMTAEGAGVTAAVADAKTWTLTLNTEHITGTGKPPDGTDTVKKIATLTRADLLKMDQHTVSLPIACVEGWSTDNQTWTGVRLADLAAMAGVPQPLNMLTRSLQQGGAFSRAVMSAEQTLDPDSLLALTVNGSDLTLDHGFPARVIVPDAPGVHNTKWVSSLTFRM